MRELKLIVFDFDGTLADTREIIVRTNQEVQRRMGYPHPEPVLKTLGAMGLSSSETLVVGDMPVDIQMGHGAGARTCGVTYGNSDRDALLAAGADYVIGDFRELPKLITPWK